MTNYRFLTDNKTLFPHLFINLFLLVALLFWPVRNIFSQVQCQNKALGSEATKVYVDKDGNLIIEKVDNPCQESNVQPNNLASSFTKNVKADTKPDIKPDNYVSGTNVTIVNNSKTNSLKSKVSLDTNIKASGATRQVKTTKGSSLWKLAFEYVGNKNNINKMMDAIYNSNKHAFVNNDRNLLKSNQEIIIPQINESGVSKKIVSLVKPDTKDKTSKKHQIITANQQKDYINTNMVKLTSLSQDLKSNREAFNNKDSMIKTNTVAEISAQSTNTNAKTVCNHTEVEIAQADHGKMQLAEKLIEKQKENQKLKDKVFVLKSQLNTVRVAYNKLKNQHLKFAALRETKLKVKKVANKYTQAKINKPIIIQKTNSLYSKANQVTAKKDIKDNKQELVNQLQSFIAQKQTELLNKTKKSLISTKINQQNSTQYSSLFSPLSSIELPQVCGDDETKYNVGGSIKR